MTTVQFLAEWAIRSSILILTGTVLLWVFRVKDPSIRLAAWITMLCGSLAIPALVPVLPGVPITIERARTPARSVELPIVFTEATRVPMKVRTPFDWPRAAVIVWALVAVALLLRLCVGFAMSLRLRRSSQPTDRSEIRESDQIAAPVTLGIINPVIVLPTDWPQWSRAKLDAVLAHERSHIRRNDPVVQLFSTIHRALLWHSPLSWFLQKQIVRTAEEASDDAALSETRDRALYAEVLLDFMRRATAKPTRLGVPMARYARPDQRINRILDGTTLSRGITKISVATILALASPFAYVIAAADLQNRDRQGAVTTSPVSLPNPVTVPAPQLIAQSTPQSLKPATESKPAAAPVYLNALGAVTSPNTVTVRARIEGELISVDFKEGELVQAGQVLAKIDGTALQLPLAQAEIQLAADEALQTSPMKTGRLRIDYILVDNAKLQLSYAQIKSPITGIAGFRIVGPGNIVRPSDGPGIVVITRLQPIAVVFNIAEDSLTQIRSCLKRGVSLPVEAWNRDQTVKIATGRLTAMDNQINQETGTLKLKAEFDNKDDALFPNQFVNVRVLLEH